MTDTTTVVAPFEPEDDLDLIIAFVQERLDPARVALVRQRLEDDPDFLHMATPFVMAATIPRRHEVEPAPRGEMERHWDEFTRRAGFIHQKRKARRRWLLALGIVAALAATAWLAREPVARWREERRNYVAVGRAGEWVTVAKNVDVRLASGARLLLERPELRAPVDIEVPYDLVKLTGTAEFRIAQTLLGQSADPVRMFVVSTDAATIGALNGSFTVRTAGDTTWVDAHALEGGAGDAAEQPTVVFVGAPSDAPAGFDYDGGVQVGAGQRARTVRGAGPEILP